MADQKTQPAPVVAATPEEVAEFRAVQEAEYGTWVAVAPISFNGAPAYNVGDPVPASNVARHKYDEDGLVAKIGTKAGQEVARSRQLAVEQVVVEQPPQVSLGIPIKD